MNIATNECNLYRYLCDEVEVIKFCTAMEPATMARIIYLYTKREHLGGRFACNRSRQRCANVALICIVFIAVLREPYCIADYVSVNPLHLVHLLLHKIYDRIIKTR